MSICTKLLLAFWRQPTLDGWQAYLKARADWYAALDAAHADASS